MPINDFVPFATAGGANVQDLATYKADPMTGSGHASGIASSQRDNRAHRQATFIAAAMGKVASDYSGLDSLDNGDLAGFVSNFEAAMKAIVFAAATKTPLLADTTFLIETTGSDSTGDGSAAHPFATIQNAVGYVYSHFDVNGHVITFSIGAGTYNGNVFVDGRFRGQTSAEQVKFTTHGGTVIINGVGWCFAARNLAQFIVQGSFQLNTSHLSSFAPATDSALMANRNSFIGVSSGVAFGASSGYHMSASGQSKIEAFQVNYAINGSATSAHWLAAECSSVAATWCTITLTGTPNFGNFAFAYDAAAILCGFNTFSGGATGGRFNVYANAVIDTLFSGASYLPGNVAGTWSLGGVYV